MDRAPQKRLRPRLDADALFEYAVRQLAVRAHSAADLKRKLRQKAAQVQDVDAAVARLKEFGYLDDRKFAEAYSGARLDREGFGRGRVFRDLRGRGVAAQTAERAVAKTYQDADETALLESYVDRKILRSKPGSLLKDPKELASAYRKLVRAGFTSGNILRVLKRRALDPDLVDSFEPPVEESEEEPSGGRDF